jgi:hypothetical protein
VGPRHEWALSPLRLASNGRVCNKKKLLVKCAAAAAAQVEEEEEEEEVEVARPASPFAAFFGGQKVRVHGCCRACAAC